MLARMVLAYLQLLTFVPQLVSLAASPTDQRRQRAGYPACANAEGFWSTSSARAFWWVDTLRLSLTLTYVLSIAVLARVVFHVSQ